MFLNPLNISVLPERLEKKIDVLIIETAEMRIETTKMRIETTKMREALCKFMEQKASND